MLLQECDQHHTTIDQLSVPACWAPQTYCAKLDQCVKTLQECYEATKYEKPAQPTTLHCPPHHIPCGNPPVTKFILSFSPALTRLCQDLCCDVWHANPTASPTQAPTPARQDARLATREPGEPTVTPALTSAHTEAKVAALRSIPTAAPSSVPTAAPSDLIDEEREAPEPKGLSSDGKEKDAHKSSISQQVDVEKRTHARPTEDADAMAQSPTGGEVLPSLKHQAAFANQGTMETSKHQGSDHSKHGMVAVVVILIAGIGIGLGSLLALHYGKKAKIVTWQSAGGFGGGKRGMSSGHFDDESGEGLVQDVARHRTRRWDAEHFDDGI